MREIEITTASAREGRRSTQSASEILRQRMLARLPIVERQLHIAGMSTRLVEGGDGPPIVLLHGPGGSALHWMRVIPKLAADHRLVIPDLPGQGASEAQPGQIDVDGVVDWLAELIARTCHDRPVLVGYALGGAIASRFAARHSSRLRHLVLVDTLGLVPFAPAPEFASALHEFLARPGSDTHERLWGYCARDLGALRDSMGATWESFEAYNLDRASTPGVMACLQALMQHFGFPEIPSKELARIDIPTTLIWGRHDLATPLCIAEQASARYEWPLHVVEDVADDPAVERPDAFLRVLRGLLERTALRGDRP